MHDVERAAIAPEAVVTFERPEGYTVVRALGVASGEAIVNRDRIRATFRTIGSLIGIAPIDYLTDAERARGESLTNLLGHARELGANGIVNLRFDASEGHDGSTRVIASGDAVVLHPAPGYYSR